jgi:hypothetical protein
MGILGLVGLVCRPLVIRDWVAGVCTWRFDQPTAGEPLRSNFFFVLTHTLSITHYTLPYRAAQKSSANCKIFTKYGPHATFFYLYLFLPLRRQSGYYTRFISFSAALLSVLVQQILYPTIHTQRVGRKPRVKSRAWSTCSHLQIWS